MSDEPSMLRTIDWRSVFPFTQLFRAFRVAIHPAKMALALVAILLVYTLGRTMDSLWLERYRAVPGEVALYEGSTSRAGFTGEVNEARATQRALRDSAARAIIAEGSRLKPGDPPLKEDASYSKLEDVVEDVRDADVKAARERYDAAADKTDALRARRDDEVRAAYRAAGVKMRALDQARGRGLSMTFIDYQATQIDALAIGVITFDWIGPDGALASLRRFVFTGPGWAISKHPLYFTLFAIAALLVWSVIGGAIARIAAVHVSQDEKISVRQALRFSTNKLMSFFAAPLMPLILVGLIALVLGAVGWLSEFAYLGGLVTIVVGALFVVLIGVGVLVACALVGWVCGFGLMYPTIAVEGSDAFDAVSRSFSYVFARPWKVFAYVVIALVYGAVTYLFLRFMCYLTLSVIHDCLTFWTGSTGPTGRTSLANAWPGPLGMFQLAAPPPYGLTFAEGLGSTLTMFWVYLFVSLLGAYLLSYFVSINTIMYYLLRYEVDATDIDDVYLEPSEDEFDDAMPEGGGAGSAGLPGTAGAMPTGAVATGTMATGAASASTLAAGGPAVAQTVEAAPTTRVETVPTTGERTPDEGETMTVGATIVRPENDGPPTVIEMTPAEPNENVERAEGDPLPPPTPPPAGS